MKRGIDVFSLSDQSKAFHIDVGLLTYDRSVRVRSPLQRQDTEYLKQLPMHSRELVYYLLEYRSMGIRMVRVNSHNVIITKEESFSWEKIDEAVINGLMMLFSQYEDDEMLRREDLVVSGDVSHVFSSSPYQKNS